MEKQAINNIVVARFLLTVGRGQHTMNDIEKKYRRRYPKTNIRDIDVNDFDAIIKHVTDQGLLKKDVIRDKDSRVFSETTVYEKTAKGWLFTSK